MGCETSCHDTLGMNLIGHGRTPDAPLVPRLPKDAAVQAAQL